MGVAVVVVTGLGAGAARGGEVVGVAAATTAPVALASLPGEARETLSKVLNGGPFPYAKDGIVFGNRERLLPAKERGHYREYTVRTPQQSGRGARRIVCGGVQPTRPEACYYTHDHYASFRRIEQ